MERTLKTLALELLDTDEGISLGAWKTFCILADLSNVNLDQFQSEIKIQDDYVYLPDDHHVPYP